MQILSQNKIALSLAILILATVAVFAPSLIFIAAAVLAFAICTFRFPTFGLAAAILAAFAGEFGRVAFSGISFLVLDLITPTVLAVWVAQKFLAKEKITLDGVSGSLLVFWAVAAASLMFGASDLSTAETKFALLYLLRFVGISGLLLVARDLAKKETEQIFRILMFGGVLFAIAGFVLFRILPDFTDAGLTELGWDPHVGRLTSTFLDPNFAAGAFAFLLALLGGKFLREKNSGRQVLFLIIAGIFGVALLLTFSRSGLLTLGVSGLVLGIFGDRRILIAGILVAILGVASSPRLAERVGELAQSVDSLGGESQQVLDPTAKLRVDSWREGWRIFTEKPLLGVGFGAYKFHQNFSDADSHAATGSDASLLNVAATTGFCGLAVFGIFLWNLAVANFRSKNWGFLAGFAGLLVHAVFVNSLFFAPLAVIFFIGAGLNPTQK